MTIKLGSIRLHLGKGALFGFPLFLALVLYGLVSACSGGGSSTKMALQTPAFPVAQISQLKPGWLSGWERSYGLTTVTQPYQYLSAVAGTPLRMDIYIPNQSAYPGFNLQGHGLVFMNAVMIEPIQTVSLSTLQTTSFPLNSPDMVAIGFPSGQTPSPGRLYQVDALLYWRTDLFYPAYQNVPVFGLPLFIADTVSSLQPAELRAPATQIEPLNLHLREGATALTIERAEWAAGREFRLLVSITNTTNATIPLWGGTTLSTAQLPGQATVAAVPDPDGPLASVLSLAPEQTVEGYLVFGADPASAAALADPSQTITLRLPALALQTAQKGDLILLQVHPTETVGS